MGESSKERFKRELRERIEKSRQEEAEEALEKPIRLNRRLNQAQAPEKPRNVIRLNRSRKKTFPSFAEEYLDFCQEFYRWRKDRKLSQSKLCEESGLPRYVIFKMDKGLMPFAVFLHVPPKENDFVQDMVKMMFKVMEMMGLKKEEAEIMHWVDGFYEMARRVRSEESEKWDNEYKTRHQEEQKQLEREGLDEGFKAVVESSIKDNLEQTKIIARRVVDNAWAVYYEGRC